MASRNIVIKSNIRCFKSVLQVFGLLVLGSLKICIFRKGLVHGFGQKNLNFFHFLVTRKMNRKEVFCGLLDRKLTFEDYNSIDSNKSKNGFLPKGLLNGFGQKLDISSFYIIKSFAILKRKATSVQDGKGA